MMYCRFQNTLTDLEECYNAMDEDDLVEEELEAQLELILLCQQLASDYEYMLEELMNENNF